MNTPLISFKKVGEVFEFNSKKYICVEVDNIFDICKTCERCAFNKVNCDDIIRCIDKAREDNKNVYFTELPG